MTSSAVPALPAWLADESRTVPAYDAFGSADELAAWTSRLAADHPGAVTLRVIGHSAAGDRLMCLTVDGGPSARADAVVFGLAHPNEPVGGLTSLHLARRLAEDPVLRRRLGLTWHIVTDIDPDGLRLNEGWLRGPFTREHYTRHFYRQAFEEQIDWNFPIDGDHAQGVDPVPPETRALMALIDTHQPALLVSLHNAEVGDVYYYLGQEEQALYPTLQRIPQELGMSLYRGMPEAAWVRPLADGIHMSLDVRDLIDHRRSGGGAPQSPADRNSSSSYAAERGALALVTEVPYWRDPRASDRTTTDVPLAEALADGGKRLADLGVALTSALAAVDGLTSVDSAFLRASRHFAASATDVADETLRQAQQPLERLATVAEVASIAETVHMFRLRNSAILLRALDGEVGVGNVNGVIRATRREMSALRSRWSAEADADAQDARIVLNPIRSLVATQYMSILATAEHLLRA